MTDKETAERLRKLIDGTSNGIVLSEAIQNIADELDPPWPEPGTVVWWRGMARGASKEWKLGEAGYGRVYQFGSSHGIPLGTIEWKPSRALASDEVAVKVPPVSQWGPRVTSIEVLLKYWQMGEEGMIIKEKLITRAEAVCMEDKDEYRTTGGQG